MTDEQNANTFLAKCRAAVSTIRGIDMQYEAEVALMPEPINRDLERENWHLRELLEGFIDLDRELSDAGRIPKEWSAQRSLVLVIRDPDESNQFVGEGEPVGLYDVDLGRMDLNDPEERAEWLGSQHAMLAELEQLNSSMCSEALRGVLAIVEGISDPDPDPDDAP